MGRVERFSLGRIEPLWTQRYAAAIDDLDPAYFDEEHARGLGYRGIIAPPNYIATLRGAPAFGPPESELLADGMAPDARPPLANLMGMGGGQTLALHEPVYCGETILAERRVVDVTEKAGRSGPLVIITEELRYRNSEGEPKLTLRNTLLCRWTDPA